ncbi:MAG: hypothetical protein QXW71_00985 [Thermoplasmata archaeon]
MTYTKVINGITVYSNIPFDQPVPSGSQYEITINTKIPIYLIAILTGIGGIATIEAMISQQNIQNLLKQNGYNGQISNYKTDIDWWGNTIKISFTATSPWVYIVGIAIILGLTAIIGYLVYMTINVISKNPAMSVGFGALEIGLGAVLIGGTAYMLYNMLKKKKKGG